MLIALIYTRYSQQYQFPQLCMHLTPQDSLIETQDSNQKQKKMDYHVVLKSTPLSSYSYSLLEFLKNRFHWLFLKDEFCSHYFVCRKEESMLKGTSQGVFYYGFLSGKEEKPNDI